MALEQSLRACMDEPVGFCLLFVTELARRGSGG